MRVLVLHLSTAAPLSQGVRTRGTQLTQQSELSPFSEGGFVEFTHHHPPVRPLPKRSPSTNPSQRSKS